GRHGRGGEAGLSRFSPDRGPRCPMTTSQLFMKFFSSLRLTVVLLVLSIILVFWATLAQVDLGVWGVQERFFRTFFVLLEIPGTHIPFPAFPGGYFLGGLLLINLIAAH